MVESTKIPIEVNVKKIYEMCLCDESDCFEWRWLAVNIIDTHFFVGLKHLCYNGDVATYMQSKKVKQTWSETLL